MARPTQSRGPGHPNDRTGWGALGRSLRDDDEDTQPPQPAAPLPAGWEDEPMVMGFDSADRHSFLADMAEGLRARAMNRAPSERARPFYRTTFTQLAFACLAARNLDPRGLNPRTDPGRVFQLANSTQSDFPHLVGNALNKIALDTYTNATPTFRKIATRRTFTSFRPQRFLRAGDFPLPLEVGEHGEIQRGYSTEGEELVSLIRYARIFGLTYEMLVNDDLGAFADLATAAAARVVDFQNSTFFALCFAPNAGLGPDLADALPVYNAGHSNIGATGALSATTIASARSLLKRAATPDGVKLNLQASTLLVSPEAEGAAESLVAPGALARATDTLPLTVLSDANLSGTRFFTLPDPNRLSNYCYGALQGHDLPSLVTQADYETNGLACRLTFSFGCGAVESRAGSTGAGA